MRSSRGEICHGPAKLRSQLQPSRLEHGCSTFTKPSPGLGSTHISIMTLVLLVIAIIDLATAADLPRRYVDEDFQANVVMAAAAAGKSVSEHLHD